MMKGSTCSFAASEIGRENPCDIDTSSRTHVRRSLPLPRDRTSACDGDAVSGSRDVVQLKGRGVGASRARGGASGHDDEVGVGEMTSAMLAAAADGDCERIRGVCSGFLP